MTDEAAAVRALFAQVLDGWNREDGAVFAAPFTDTVDFVAFDGTHLTTRELPLGEFIRNCSTSGWREPASLAKSVSASSALTSRC